MSPRAIAGLGEIAGDFDLILLDLWGCLHDGVTIYPGAKDCLDRLRAKGKRIILVSNAPRRIAAALPRLRAMGLPDSAHDGLMTSGEIAWRNLARRSDPAYRALGRKVYPILAEKDRGFCDGLDLDLVPNVESADFILALGLEDGEAVADYADRLAAARRRDLPLLCANPDLLVHRGGTSEPCAGALGAAYEKIGGRVLYEGKPHPGIYRHIFAGLAATDFARVLAIGDSLRTDIRGAAMIGISSLLVAGGIHRAEFLPIVDLDRAALDAACLKLDSYPDFVLPYLAW